MPIHRKFLQHERMLQGAIDSYIGGLVHVQPHRADDREAQLEQFAEQWIAAGNPNDVEAVSSEWLQHYLDHANDRAAAEDALVHFYRWAARESLIEQNPLAR